MNEFIDENFWQLLTILMAISWAVTAICWYVHATLMGEILREVCRRWDDQNYSIEITIDTKQHEG